MRDLDSAAASTVRCGHSSSRPPADAHIAAGGLKTRAFRGTLGGGGRRRRGTGLTRGAPGGRDRRRAGACTRRRSRGPRSRPRPPAERKRTVSDPRYRQLADVLVHHSCRVQPGEKVLVEAFDVPEEFTLLLVRAIAEAGGLPLCITKQNRVLRELYAQASEEQMRFWGQVERMQMEGVQAYIGVRGSRNITELSDVAPEKMRLYERLLWQAVHIEVRVPKTRWVVLRWPSPAMAQQAHRSTEAFESFFFDVCTVDYAEMAEAVKPLAERMERARDVRIVGPGTDLRFSIAGIPVVACAGRHNIPDGEIFTSPVRDSAEGTLSVNTRTLYQGVVFEDIRLRLAGGRIVEATANHAERLNQILDSDEGARYIGEFALGFNPRIREPMMDTLFDEKIAGSFHFTPGQAYDDADNGNRSQIHWDLVTIQRREHGGGEIYFDGELIRKDGSFVPEDLRALDA
ncbi:MAG: aminopeptidase [Planctomycetes bacterium]|nr:aminopeptidase [Planctomycetota bacterium]